MSIATWESKMSNCLSPFVHLSDGTVGIVGTPSLGGQDLVSDAALCLLAIVSLGLSCDLWASGHSSLLRRLVAVLCLMHCGVWNNVPSKGGHVLIPRTYECHHKW